MEHPASASVPRATAPNINESDPGRFSAWYQIVNLKESQLASALISDQSIHGLFSAAGCLCLEKEDSLPAASFVLFFSLFYSSAHSSFHPTTDQSPGRDVTGFSEVLFEPPFAHAIFQRFQQMKQLIMENTQGCG